MLHSGTGRYADGRSASNAHLDHQDACSQPSATHKAPVPKSMHPSIAMAAEPRHRPWLGDRNTLVQSASCAHEFSLVKCSCNLSGQPQACIDLAVALKFAQKDSSQHAVLVRPGRLLGTLGSRCQVSLRPPMATRQQSSVTAAHAALLVCRSLQVLSCQHRITCCKGPSCHQHFATAGLGASWT